MTISEILVRWVWFVVGLGALLWGVYGIILWQLSACSGGSVLKGMTFAFLGWIIGAYALFLFLSRLTFAPVIHP